MATQQTVVKEEPAGVKKDPVPAGLTEEAFNLLASVATNYELPQIFKPEDINIATLSNLAVSGHKDEAGLKATMELCDQAHATVLKRLEMASGQVSSWQRAVVNETILLDKLLKSAKSCCQPHTSCAATGQSRA